MVFEMTHIAQPSSRFGKTDNDERGPYPRKVNDPPAYPSESGAFPAHPSGPHITGRQRPACALAGGSEAEASRDLRAQESVPRGPSSLPLTFRLVTEFDGAAGGT